MPSHQHNHLHRREGIVDGVENAANEFKLLLEREPATVYKTVYETMSATFDGPIAGYSTLGQAANNAETETQPAATTTQEAQTKATTDTNAKAAETTAQTPAQTPDATAKAVDTTSASAAQAENTSPVSTAKATTADEISSTLPGEIIPTGSVDLSEHSTLAIATSTPTTLVQATKNLETSDATSATSAAAAASASSTATSDSSSTDTSSAAKAGIAIGVLGGVLVVGLLIFFLFGRRRKQMEKQRAQDDEKINGPMSGRPVSLLSTRTTATAPQLSVRPVTQFMPNFGERRSSKGAALALATGATSANAEKTPRSPWERPSTSHANNPENPFGNTAERAYTPTNDHQPSNPFDNPENVVGVAQTTNSPPKPSLATGATAAGAVAGAAAAAAITRQASTRKNAPAPLDLTIPPAPPSPAGTEFSVHSVAPGQSPGPSRSAAAIAEAGGPVSSAVHRVQLDFNPTLEDEMGLRAGQLVRLLHEYDDGWVSTIFTNNSLISHLLTSQSVSLHSTRPFAARCCSQNLLVDSSGEASSCWRSSWCSQRPACEP